MRDGNALLHRYPLSNNNPSSWQDRYFERNIGLLSGRQTLGTNGRVRWPYKVSCPCLLRAPAPCAYSLMAMTSLQKDRHTSTVRVPTWYLVPPAFLCTCTEISSSCRSWKNLSGENQSDKQIACAIFSEPGQPLVNPLYSICLGHRVGHNDENAWFQKCDWGKYLEGSQHPQPCLSPRYSQYLRKSF